MKETQCQTPCKAQCQAQQNTEDIYFDYVMSEVASIAVEYGICLQQTKAAKERYLTKLKLFDKQVAKKAKKKVVKITPYSEFNIEVKEDLTDKEKELTMQCLEFTNKEYSDYLKLRKKSNYLKGKLLKCVSTNFEFE